jgi:hypothetical protein
MRSTAGRRPAGEDPLKTLPRQDTAVDLGADHLAKAGMTSDATTGDTERNRPDSTNGRLR